jgi:hypothetical protein
MSKELDHMPAERRSGTERFTDSGADLGFSLLEFWQWSGSDLVANTWRGVLAEYVVGRALAVDLTGAREEWAPYDLQTSRGVKVEVKSTAYLQSWHQEKPSVPSFGIRETRAWDAGTGQPADEARRQADVYVFAVLAHRDKASVNPLDVGQWEFYVVATQILNDAARRQQSLSLSALKRMGAAPVSYRQLAGAVEDAAASQTPPER